MYPEEDTVAAAAHTSILGKSLDDEAYILLELKQEKSPRHELSFSPAASPVPSPSFPTGEESECQLKDCLLCARGVPILLVRSPTWASIMRVVFYSLQSDSPNKYYFNLKTDVYGFMTSHWKKLCLDKKRSDNWHKQIQDMLSHSKNLFESGMDKYKQNGFWRMKQLTDPWTIRKDKRKSPKRTPDRKSEDEESRPTKKRRSVDSDEEDDDKDDSDENQEELEMEIKKLRNSLMDLNQAVDTLKDELRKKDDQLSERNISCHNLLEQLNQTRLQLQLQAQQFQQLQQLQKFDSYPHPFGLGKKHQWHIHNPIPPLHINGSVPSIPNHAFGNKAVKAAPVDPRRWLRLDDDEFRDGEVPKMMKLTPLSIVAHS